jgi:hypothetical protein
MEAWKKLIGGGFAGMDAPFALHPNDQERAMNMISVMQAANVSWSEAEAAIREYLLAQGVHGPRLEKQMGLVNELVRPKLRG